MPRKKAPAQTITLFYPNLIKVGVLRSQVINKYGGRIAPINFFLLFNILSEPYFEFNSKDEEKAVQIHRNALRCLFRDNYRTVIDDLVAAGYIMKDSSYEVGKNCMSYWFHPDIIDETAPFLRVEEEVNGYFRSKLNTLNQLNLCTDRTDDARQHIIDQTSNLMLVPDAEALDYVRKRYIADGNVNPPNFYFDYFNNSPLKRTGIDVFGERVHSIITNMPKALRRCLRYISCPEIALRESDIVNSQPFFLSAATPSLIARFVPDAIGAIPIFKRFEQNPNWKAFQQVCTSGEVYDTLMKAYEKEHGTICQGDYKAKRDFAKTLTFGVLFGDYESKDANSEKPCATWLAETKRRFYLIYKEKFHAAYELFKGVKSLYMECTVNKKGERKQYANNCLLAQRLESGIMYSHVVKALLDNGYTELVTIHDCVLVREDEFEQVKAIITHEFGLLGLKPQLK